jgi:hypothetical protein
MNWNSPYRDFISALCSMPKVWDELRKNPAANAALNALREECVSKYTPRRVGGNIIIWGYVLELTPRTAQLLELALNVPSDDDLIDAFEKVNWKPEATFPELFGTSLEEVCEVMSLKYPSSTLSKLVNDLKKKLKEATQDTPFRIDVSRKNSRITAKILPKW